jgi:hypothetical protein
MTKRGRPVFSQVRQNIVEILYVIGNAYGYEIFKSYKALFAPITLRLVYYHLKKGVQIGEFKIKQIEKRKGDYSWGPETERIIYQLGSKASPKMNSKVRDYFNKKKKS